MKKAILLGLFIFVSLLAPNPVVWANVPQEDPYGVYYRHGRVFGKIVHYDADRDLCIIYGSVFVMEPGGSWRLLESQKYHMIHPASVKLRKKLTNATGKTVAVEGSLNAWPGQKEEVLLAKTVSFSDYDIETPPWFAFGRTIKTESVYKFNLNHVNDFIDNLAELAEAIGIPQNRLLQPAEISVYIESLKNPDNRSKLVQLRNELNKNWSTKWCVTKDAQASNEMRAGVGGWQIYRGLLGAGNCYVEEAPVIRKNMDNFMDAVTGGGGTPEEEGRAIMCANINVKRSRIVGEEKIVKVTASGALYDSLSYFYNALIKPTRLNQESWRLEGWSQNSAEIMENKVCWLSGRRVLVYETDEETGKKRLVDQYFRLDNYLTQDGFNNILNIGNEILTAGGI